MKLVFLDTETTGLPESEPFLSEPSLGPEITEYAIADWEDGNVTNVEHKLIMPQNPPEPDAEGTYRTLDGFPLSFRLDTWKGKAVHWNLTDVNAMYARLDGQLLAGSNPQFDMNLIRWECARVGWRRPTWSHRKLDLNGLGYLLWIQGLVKSTSLVNLAIYFGIEHEAHTSKGDVLASITVWEALHDLFVYRPALMREALTDVAECSPDEGMAEMAKRALNGEALG